MNLLNNDEIPIGLGMALAQNLHAMQKFGEMSEEQQQAFIGRCRNAESKQEMQKLVSELE